MVHQHREFHARLNDVKKLQLYAQSTVSKHQALDASLAKAKSRSKNWEQEDKACVEKVTEAENEIDKVREEA